jgi:hypothetical protein
MLLGKQPQHIHTPNQTRKLKLTLKDFTDNKLPSTVAEQDELTETNKRKLPSTVAEQDELTKTNKR